MDRGDTTSDSRVAGATDHRGLPRTSAPAYLVRDNDRAYGRVFMSRLRAMGIREWPISPRSPWQNGYAERLIGTLRRECLDRMLVFASRTCDEFLLCMRPITIKRARTWHYRKMRRCIEPSNDLAPLSPFRYWLDCITNTSGYDFRKGQPIAPLFCGGRN